MTHNARRIQEAVRGAMTSQDSERPQEEILVFATPQQLKVGDAISLRALQHLTLHPPSIIFKDRWPVLDAALQDMLLTDMPRNMLAGERANFGSNEAPKMVRKLDGLDLDLRIGVLTAIENVGGIFDETYAGENTESHVSDTLEHSLEENAVFCIDAMYAAVRDVDSDSARVVRAAYQWRRPSRWYIS